jgi:hypothetical protein
MTRKSSVCWQVEALEPKVLLTARPTLIQPLQVSSTTPGLVPPAPLPSTGEAPATVGNPTAPQENALVGSYGHAGRSLAVNAEGNVPALGPVSVSGSIRVSGPRSNQNVSGMVTLTGAEGSVTIQLQASKLRTVVGNRYGPAPVTVTAIGATGNGTAVQGESGSGFLGLGHSVRTKHGKMGDNVVAHGSFWLFVGLNSQGG